ncbi:MAG TPA: YIP1 family protein [Bdellovibrionota bacterium]|nr:YIP1 family protein [Bdellovibrionota bacterium]
MESQAPTPPTDWERPGDPVRRFLHDLKDIHLRPTAFFRSLPTTGGLAGPLAFALVAHWAGTGLEFLWDQLTGQTLQKRIQDMFRMLAQYSDVDTVSRDAWIQKTQDSVWHFVTGVGTVIADPFLTLLGIVVTAALATLGAKLLVPEQPGRPPVTFETTTRVICYGLAPAVLTAVPYLGGITSKIWILVATVTGIRETYRVSGGRAFVITVFPKLLFFTLILAVVLFIAVLVLGLFGAALKSG